MNICSEIIKKLKKNNIKTEDLPLCRCHASSPPEWREFAVQQSVVLFYQKESRGRHENWYRQDPKLDIDHILKGKE